VREPQYDECLTLDAQHGRHRLGLMSSQTYHDDPKRLGFTLARYKFAAKMLQGCPRVLEIGCGDGFATRIVAQHVGHVTAVDWDATFIADATARQHPANVEFRVHDMAQCRLSGRFDGAYALDVLEHITPATEDAFIGNVCHSLKLTGTLVIGMPSLESQRYACAGSIRGHVNCKTDEQLRETLGRHFENVYTFGMNDETLHTGFGPMCHYRLAVCCGVKQPWR